MMEIQKLTEDNLSYFSQLFCTYFQDDLNFNYSQEIIKTKIIKELIWKQIQEKIIFVDLACVNQKPIGFLIYQIDSEKSDWNKQSETGFLRELYILKDQRRKGYGSILLLHAETILKEHGACKIYLKAEDKTYVQLFYLHLGYISKGKVDKVNHKEYFIKELL